MYKYVIDIDHLAIELRGHDKEYTRNFGGEASSGTSTWENRLKNSI
jgi:hypothetical protein